MDYSGVLVAIPAVYACLLALAKRHQLWQSDCFCDFRGDVLGHLQAGQVQETSSQNQTTQA